MRPGAKTGSRVRRRRIEGFGPRANKDFTDTDIASSKVSERSIRDTFMAIGAGPSREIGLRSGSG